jgi:hypothetical protein
MQKLKIQTGHPVTADVAEVNADCVRFVDENNRTVFEVSSGNGCITVRAVEFHKVDGVMHEGTLMVLPKQSNSIEIHTPVYQERIR